MGFIYCITNKTNNKKYIGQTTFSIDERWKRHLADSKKKSLEKRPLYNAINHYGEENFQVDCLEECSNIILNDREIYWIDYYNTYLGEGYNATPGGDQRKIVNEENIINYYLKLKSIRKVHNELDYDEGTIRKVLKNNNIHIFSKKEQSNKIQYYCLQCNKAINKNITLLCKKCYNNKISKQSAVPKREILKNKIRNQSFNSIAKEYSVARATIFRWCDKYNLPNTKEKINQISTEEWETI